MQYFGAIHTLRSFADSPQEVVNAILDSMKNMVLTRQKTNLRAIWITCVVLYGMLFFPLSGSAEESDQFEPEVLITPKEDGQIKEYRVGGSLYMIEITPEKGPTYYLLDIDGDGVMETRRHNVEPDLLIPNWKILRWK